LDNGIKDKARPKTGLLSNNILSIAGYIFGIAGVILILISASIIASSPDKDAGSTVSQILLTDNITVTDLGTNSGIINFITSNEEAVDVMIYDRDGKILGFYSDDSPVKSHAIKVDNLSPSTTYYFQLLSGNVASGKHLTGKYKFVTLEQPPLILNVRISKTTEAAALIAWETDIPATNELTYWEEGKEERITISESLSSTNHAVMLQPLNTKRVYAFVIKANDASGLQPIAEYEGILSLKAGAQLTQRAPDFVLPTVKGDKLKLSDYRGKVVLLAFWHMTCPSCQKEMLLLQAAYEREGAGKISIIAVHGPGREEAIKSYCSSHGLTLPVLMDIQGDVGSSYGVMQLPATFILDQSGVIRSVDPAFENLKELDAVANQFLIE